VAEYARDLLATPAPYISRAGTVPVGGTANALR
jgi:hypothetical protein